MSYPAVALPIPQLAQERPGQLLPRGDALAVLFPVYAALAKRFDWSPPPCPFVPEDHDHEQIVALERWLEQVDDRLDASQLRKFFQTENEPTEENLRHLIRRYLSKTGRTLSNRDKLDFLLVQYVYCCSPVAVIGKEITPQDVAATLQPVLRDLPREESATRNSCIEPLQEILCQARNCKSLSELLERECLEQGRWLKDSVGNSFWESGALVTFTWFNTVMRWSWFRLVYTDLQAIRSALDELEQFGVHQVDCHRAQLSANEDVAHLYEICNTWKEAFAAPYEAGRPMSQIAALRVVVQETLMQAIPRSDSAPVSPGPFSAKVGETPVVDLPKSLSESEPQPLPAALAALELLEPAEATPNAPAAHASHIRSGQSPLQACLALIHQQLKSPSARQNRASGEILYNRTRLLLHSWEIEAFEDSGAAASALQTVVAARALLAEAQDEFRFSGNADQLDVAIALAEQQVSELKKTLEQARQQQSVAIAANLSASSKRLLASIAKAKKLRAGK